MSSGRFTHRSCAASVWPTPEMSSFSPSTVNQRHVADGGGVHKFAAMHHAALGRGVLDEDRLHGLQ